MRGWDPEASPERTEAVPDRTLHLLRHAKSSRGDPAVPDRERPLSKRGRKACKLVAAHLQDAGIRPDAVVCSPARRTLETLERIRPGLPEDADGWTEERIYDAAPEQLLALVREIPESYRRVLVLGHNPGVGGLADLLAGDGPALAELRRKFPTGALASLGFRGAWVDLRPGAAVLEGFVRPKDLS